MFNKQQTKKYLDIGEKLSKFEEVKVPSLYKEFVSFWNSKESDYIKRELIYEGFFNREHLKDYKLYKSLGLK